jgi:hypothetical protein
MSKTKQFVPALARRPESDQAQNGDYQRGCSGLRGRNVWDGMCCFRNRSRSLNIGSRETNGDWWLIELLCGNVVGN